MGINGNTTYIGDPMAFYPPRNSTTDKAVPAAINPGEPGLQVTAASFVYPRLTYRGTLAAVTMQFGDSGGNPFPGFP